MTHKTEQPEWMEAYLAEADLDGYVPFNADRRLGQNQYASCHVSGSHGGADLGAGLRWKIPEHGTYHDIRIHKDDLLTFHARFLEHRQKTLEGR